MKKGKDPTKFTIEGVTKSLREWAKDNDIKYRTLENKIYLDNMEINEAINQLVGKKDLLNQLSSLGINRETYQNRRNRGLSHEEAIGPRKYMSKYGFDVKEKAKELKISETNMYALLQYLTLEEIEDKVNQTKNKGEEKS